MTTDNTEVQPQLGDDTVPFEQQNLEESGSVEETPEPEINWQERYEAENAAHNSTKADRRSQDIDFLSRKESDLLLRQSIEQQKVTAAYIAEGRQEELPQAIQEVEDKYTKQVGDERTQDLHSTVNALAMAAAAELGIDANDSPEFENVRLFWGEAVRTGREADYEKVRAEIEIAKGKVKEVTHKDEIAAAEKRGQERERKAIIDEADAISTDTGNGAPGGSGEVDVEVWRKLPAAERLKQLGSLLGRE